MLERYVVRLKIQQGCEMHVLLGQPWAVGNTSGVVDAVHAGMPWLWRCRASVALTQQGQSRTSHNSGSAKLSVSCTIGALRLPVAKDAASKLDHVRT